MTDTITQPGRRTRSPVAHARRRIYVGLTVGVLVLASVAVLLLLPDNHWRDGTRHGRWVAAFDGFGVTTSTGSGAEQAITLSPKRTRKKTETHSALVVTTTQYRDFVATARVKTQRQLRQGAAGSPNPWEVGWLVWHYTSNQRFYALTLGPSGWVLSKQDPAYPGGQRFLATGKSPKFAINSPHTAGIVQIGNRITVSGDGKLLAQFRDTERPYLQGAGGLYTEDSRARFDHLKISPLPAEGS